MPFTVTECTVTTSSIKIAFSDPVIYQSDSPKTTQQKEAFRNSALNPANYNISAPGSVHFAKESTLASFNSKNPTKPAILKIESQRFVTIQFNSGEPGVEEFKQGSWVTIAVRHVRGLAATDEPQPTIEGGLAMNMCQVPGAAQDARITKDFEDAISYPILTEEVSYRRSPVGISSGGGVGTASAPVGSLGLVAANAVGDVLGWKANVADPKGFVGALTQAFTLTDIEGHVESTWNPRTYAVQSDLGGGITGAQASLYMRAKNALDSALPLLDGLYPLNPEADPEYVKALREMARSQMTEIVKELGVVGLPSVLRIDTYFNILLGQNPAELHKGDSVFDPDSIKGTLGELRSNYGIQFLYNRFNNSVEDEQDITNFRVVSDYMTSLMQSWIENRKFFIVKPRQPAFFGTQLVLISRQFTTITETVNEVRFALDSVFIGPSERQTLLVEFYDPTLAPMFLEDVLVEVEKFVSDEGPRLLRDGGKISVTNNILPVVRSLQKLIKGAHDPSNKKVLPDGFKTARVRNTLDDLRDQLGALVELIDQVKQKQPTPEVVFGEPFGS